MMEHILDKLRGKLVLDTGRDFYVERWGTILKLDAARFVYFANEMFGGTVVFVDGGSAELFSAADFSLYLFRISVVQYHGTNHASTVTRDVSTFLDFDEEKAIRIQLFGVEEIFSQELQRRAAQYFALHPAEDLSALGAALLQLCEFVEIQRISSELPARACIVRDGSLDVFFEIFSEVDEQLKQRQIFLCGLSKTNTLRTTNGRSVALVLEKKNNGGAWQYPLTKHLFFVKLHAKAKQVFRCDVSLPHYSVFAALAAHAADPVFLGYPYGLIEADRSARITGEEAAFLRKNIKMRLGKDAANLAVLLGTSTTHEILDKIRF